ncbi:hypothetical protein CONLIGDRAFT_580705 [Coniochaeta ligniaria NRRL 30616]|uniref:Vps41 beta-propeller domain-containing protein n=1 Tax=Coniochaeta ligniaria NRRL 30616 TaxID=1408157 RepID=A0A1J7JA48_9PEZI|nr:hypothetical protein CONLIGDRAFT_580705 [Coniochaeta ligniaria NRRL 30616]
MTDGPLDAGDDKRDDKALDASPAAAPAADPATLASATEAPPAHSGDTEAEDTAASTVDEDGDDDEDDDEDDGDEEEEEEEDEEPKLKYARLTPHLGAVYRNADATSSFLVAGDKMIIGSHNGNIHVIQLPLFQSLRVYHAHSASVTSISISPYPPPIFSKPKHDLAAKVAAQETGSPHRPGSRAASDSRTSAAAVSRKREDHHAVPNTPSNNIYIATSSMDGNVCVQSLVDVKDVTLRNFARPVQAVALSPDYKNDRTYLSGGLAGQLVLTVGAPHGRSNSTTVGTAAAAAGWLGSVGLGTNTGKDTVLHSGEGTITAIKWSLSGKYVAVINEHGVWIWRTNLHLDKSEAEDGWKRIGHVDRPQTEEWDTMAAVWRGRLEWIDESAAEPGEDQGAAGSSATAKLKQQQLRHSQQSERLIIGWGGIVWLVRVNPVGFGVGKHVGERSAANAEVIQKFRMDCIVSGISLYTRNQLLVLAYCLPDEDEEEEPEPEAETVRGHKSRPSIASTSSEPAGGIKRRQNNLPPELRLIDLNSETESPMESLSVSRFERLSASDYHLGVLPAQNAASAVASSKGALEAIASLSTDMWNAAINPVLNPISLFSSAASVRSKDSNDGGSSTKVPSTSGTLSSLRPGESVHPNLLKPGIKIFIHSPYDCILATKRDLADHLGWLLERQRFQDAWELVDEHPEITSFADKQSDIGTVTPDRNQGSDDFYEDTASVVDGMKKFYSSAEKEKRRIGELWIQQLVKAGDWSRAGQICGKVLGSAESWEKWIWAFAGANKFDEIANYMPTEPLRPPIRPIVYEAVLGHYIQADKLRLRELLDRWSTELYDLNTITAALEDQLRYREVREDSVEDGEVGRDWRLIMESLAKLHEANGRNREALKCYIKLQDADNAMRLIKDGHLAEAVADDIPAFITLRVPQDMMNPEELEEATREPITLLVDEAQHGLVKPSVVVNQLQEKVLNRYTFFYLRGLWNGEGIKEHSGEFRERLVLDSKTLVDEFADLAVHLFATFDRSLLMDFLKTSTAYAFEKAIQECENHNFIPELVYLYSKKTGEVKRALYLIIDRLRDVSQAIAFAKEQEDPDLWEDLLNYSMDKPRFIRGLLEEVGTAINPITLVRRIPEGLEIPGLREGLKHIMKEHEIQFSISAGVAKVLRSEVAAAQTLLRNGQRKGVKFEVAVREDEHLHVKTKDVPTPEPPGQGENGSVVQPAKGQPSQKGKKWQPGHCAQCHEPFREWEDETLVGFTCGHVFHLTHLLECLHPGEPVDTDFLMSQPEEGSGSTHFVGPKVTRARLLRDRIRGGCPVCVSRDVSI